MATYEKTALGSRLARIRKEKRFKTAQALADAVPAESVTKATIVNIEAGRKSDPSMLEIMQIASALGVRPIELMVDFENPYDLMGKEFAEPYASMTVVRYVAASNVLGVNAGANMRTAMSLNNALERAERDANILRWVRERPTLFSETEVYAPMEERFGFNAQFADGSWHAVSREWLSPEQIELRTASFLQEVYRLEGALHSRNLASDATPDAIVRKARDLIKYASEIEIERIGSTGLGVPDGTTSDPD